MIELLMGNEAVAVGALAAGVRVVSGYPGTPSSEVLETIARRNPGWVHVEWSVNEKAGAEVAAGAAYAGARSLVTMKQMGLNVASDPIMCVNYIGVKGGMVIYVADDPGPISSQTEQDTRSFGRYAHIPVFDCDSPEQAFRAVQDAFDFSEKHQTPVILRSTTRVCHSCADVDVPEIKKPEDCEGFVKDSRWVIFPKLAYEAKLKVAGREPLLSDEFSDYLAGAGSAGGNSIEGSGPVGIACGGISYSYVREAIAGHEENFTVLKIATPYPFPAALARRFLMSVDKVLVFEELDPYIEDALIYEYGNISLDIDNFISGKRTGTVPAGGELNANLVSDIIYEVTGKGAAIRASQFQDMPELPVRPPVLCAGCPHRGAFYAVKAAVREEQKAGESGFTQAIYCGDIGCYTLGNAAPLNMVDTCLCMGAGITVAQGLGHADSETLNFAFTGDSTFFASGITGTVNAVYNQSDMILCVLDNSTTAMTGHQPHPGMGITMMGKRVEPIDIAKVLEGIGVASIRTVDPLDLEGSVGAIRQAIKETGVRAIIFKSPCIAITDKGTPCEIGSACVGCMRCVNEIGCPALIPYETDKGAKKVRIDSSLCTGCGLCGQICPAGVISNE
ncbi:MAG: thiamine pyrophosphate-dependent enzyme [Bacillota bacterium]|nr:thiamine pyrophosphate-dependent enzyme [Bacillota bacterium]